MNGRELTPRLDVTQEGSDVGGDQVGRDKLTNNTYNYSLIQSKQNISTMTRLLGQFAFEVDKDVKMQNLIEALDHYHCNLEVNVIGLEQKLKNGNRDSIIDYALRAKESFHKKLIRYQLYEAAQKINAHLLAQIESKYQLHVYPMIYAEHPQDLINHLIDKKVVEPVLEELEENSLGYTALEINGMLYFLTGNCHIKWTK